MSAFDDGAFDCAANATRCSVGVGKRIPEYTLDIPANVTVDSSTPTLYGSHELSSPQVQELFDLLDAQLVRVPPSEARTYIVSPPASTSASGEVMYGKSVAESTDPSRIQRRLPTIVSPLHMGVKFKLQTIETPQSTCTQVTCTQHTILVVRNITLVMPESTFSNLSLSDWFEISTQSLTRVCFANTVLLLKSCEGFENPERSDEQVELYCCLLRDCISYRQQQVIQLGFPAGELDPIQCYGADDFVANSGVHNERLVTGLAAAAACAVFAAMLLGLFAWCSRRKGWQILFCARRSSHYGEGGEQGRRNLVTNECTYEPMVHDMQHVKSLHGRAGGNATRYTSDTRASYLDFDTSISARASRLKRASTATERLLIAIEGYAYADPPQGFCGRFVFSGETVQGGQSVVAFAQNSRAGMQQFAIKFFFNHADYETELRLYEKPVCRTCLPQLVQALEGTPSEARGYEAYTFPPCLVTDRGITLQQWLESSRSPSAALAMVAEVAGLLGTMHRGGIVHRDIKPANLLLVLRTQKWRLLDLGIATRRGHRGSVKCTLSYGAPEAVCAHHQGQPLMVEPSLDVWALGVIAYESLTGNAVFPPFSDTKQTHECACGHAQYPWEVDAAPDTWRKARSRSIFERCLQRRPQARPSAAEVLQALRKLEHVTTYAQP